MVHEAPDTKSRADHSEYALIICVDHGVQHGSHASSGTMTCDLDERLAVPNLPRVLHLLALDGILSRVAELRA